MDRAHPSLRMHANPPLRAPVLICAFAGWNDAAEVASHAAKFLVRRWGAIPFADIDPEDFFVFTEQRPHVRLDQGAQRRIDWPATEFYFRRAPGDGQDSVIVLGHEPHMRWRTFVDLVLGLASRFEAPLVVTLGGLLADVPHTRPARLTGSATEPHYAERLGRLNVRSSRYEGPTGIVGVLNQACRARGIAAVSLWGNVPHYISYAPNPKVSVALLRRLDALLDLGLDLSELEESVDEFDVQVEDAIARDPEAQAYVRKLEQRDESGDDDLEPELGAPLAGEFPTGEDIVRELEEFLKRRNDEERPG